jgi:multiple sugar transport system substrate-binding protein
MSQRRRQFFAAAASSVVGVIAAACTPGDLVPGSSPAPVKVTGKIAFYGSEPDIQKPALEAFAKAHPGVTTELVAHAGDEKLVAMIASGSAPDLFESGEINIPTMLKKNLAKPLDPFIARDKFDINDFHSAIVDAQRYEGKLLSLTDRFSTQMLTYNRAMFQKAGVAEPASSWTYEQWLEASKKLTRDTDDPPAWGAYMPNWWAPVYDVIWAYGGDIFSKDGTKCELGSAESVAALQFVADLWNKHGAAVPPSYTSVRGQGGGALFQQGRIGSQIEGLWVAPALAKVENLDWRMVAKPKGPKGRANYLHMAIYAIASTTKNEDTAWEWLKFWTGKAGYEAKGPGAEQGQPARKSLEANPRGAALAWLRDRGATQAYKDSVDTLRLPNKVLDFFAVQAEIDKALRDVWAGTATARAAADQVAPVVNGMLAKAAAT